MIWTCMDSFNGLTSFLARYLLAGTLFGFGSNQAKICSRSLKLPSDQLYLAFKVNISSMKRNTVQCFGHPLDHSYIFSSADFLTFSKFGKPLALAANTSALVWRNNWLRKSPSSNSSSLLSLSMGLSSTSSL